MGLIYVNPEGPNGKPDPLASARDIRETFKRMAMDDEETVALIAGGHTFGKTHGAGDAAAGRSEARRRGSRRAGPRLEEHASAAARAATRSPAASRAPGRPTPITWDNGYFDTLFGFDWELTKSPAGAFQWMPKGGAAADAVPDAHDPAKRHPPVMLTSDLALKVDPIYATISKRFHENPGKVRRRLRAGVVQADPSRHGPARALSRPGSPRRGAALAGPGSRMSTHPLIDATDIKALKAKILATGPFDLRSSSRPPGPRPRPSAAPTSAAARTARASASRRRRTGRSTSPPSWRRCWRRSTGVQKAFNAARPAASRSRSPTSSCSAARPPSSRRRRRPATTSRFPSRRAAPTRRRNRPTSRPSRRWSRSPTASATTSSRDWPLSAEELLIDKAQLLTLTAPEMTVLIGGLRALNANVGKSPHGVFTKRRRR